MKSYGPLKDFDMGSHYIITRSARLDDLDMEEVQDSSDFRWREKARRLQVRRWQKIRHQINR